jgi:hypothetical protein
MRSFLMSAVISLTLAASAFAGENLKLNPNLDYTSDSQDGPLITGDKMEAGVIAGKPACIIVYGEACYNSKRQARRTVSLYEKYKGQVQFVVIDLDRYLSRAQQELRQKYYHGTIPHVVVLNASGTVLYNADGEVEERVISGLLDKALR